MKPSRFRGNQSPDPGTRACKRANQMCMPRKLDPVSDKWRNSAIRCIMTNPTLASSCPGLRLGISDSTIESEMASDVFAPKSIRGAGNPLHLFLRITRKLELPASHSPRIIPSSPPRVTYTKSTSNIQHPISTMSKVLAVFGATGQQGSSVVNHVLDDPELSPEFKIRAITRDVNSDKAKQLSEKKVEVVQGDGSDRASLELALAGVHTVFAMTTPSFGPDGLEVEYNVAKTIADVAVEKGAKYIIFSTLPAVKVISGGKYTAVTPFDAKAKAEQYIRGLPIKSAFFSGGFFMENFHSQPFLNPQKASDSTWVLARPVSGQTKLPYIDAVGDTGKFVGAILAEPDKYEGKVFCAAVALYTLEEIAAILSRATGKTVVYKQISLEEFKKGLPFAPDLFAEGYSFAVEFGGYFGPDSEKSVAWAAKNIRVGKLTTLEEYLTAHPPQLV